MPYISKDAAGQYGEALRQIASDVNLLIFTPEKTEREIMERTIQSKINDLDKKISRLANATEPKRRTTFTSRQRQSV